MSVTPQASNSLPQLPTPLHNALSFTPLAPTPGVCAETPLSALDTPAEDENSVSGILPMLQNIVATVNLDCRLDLKTIALHARNAEYNPKVLHI